MGSGTGPSTTWSRRRSWRRLGPPDGPEPGIHSLPMRRYRSPTSPGSSPGCSRCSDWQTGASPGGTCSARRLKGHDWNADLTLEHAGLRVERRIGRIELEERSCVELHPATGQPLAQHRLPCRAKLGCVALEMTRGVPAARNHCLHVGPAAGEVRRNLDAGVVAQLVGRRDARIVLTDPIARPSEEIVGGHPRSYALCPEVHETRAVRPDVAKIGDGGRPAVDELHVEGGCDRVFFHISIISSLGHHRLTGLAFGLIALAVFA